MYFSMSQVFREVFLYTQSCSEPLIIYWTFTGCWKEDTATPFWFPLHSLLHFVSGTHGAAPRVPCWCWEALGGNQSGLVESKLHCLFSEIKENLTKGEICRQTTGIPWSHGWGICREATGKWRPIAYVKSCASKEFEASFLPCPPLDELGTKQHDLCRKQLQ